MADTRAVFGVSDLPLVTHHLTAVCRTWAIRAVADETMLLAIAGDREPFPFGLMLWESAVGLAQMLGEAATSGGDDRQPLVGRRVLDLGCGVGLTAIVAAALGADVTAIDHDPLALALAADNAARNAVTGIAFVEADWLGLAAAMPTPTSTRRSATSSAASGDRLYDPYHLILGADVAFDRANHAALAGIVAGRLARTGRALFADPGRHDGPAFLARLSAMGCAIVTSEIAIPDLRQPYRTVSVTLAQVTRDPR